jgi:hypothetical protein
MVGGGARLEGVGSKKRAEGAGATEVKEDKKGDMWLHLGWVARYVAQFKYGVSRRVKKS